MGRKTINVIPTRFNEHYNITIEMLTDCAKFVNNSQLVDTMTVSNITASQAPFEIDFGTCEVDVDIKVTVTDAMDCQVVLNQTIDNPYKVVCDTVEDLGLDFSFETVQYDPHAGLDPIADALLIDSFKNREYVVYKANKTGVFNNASSVVSDIVSFSLDGGITWRNGDIVERYNAFNTFAKILPICHPYNNNGEPSNYFGLQVFSGRWIIPDGNGQNFSDINISFNIVASSITQSSSTFNSYGQNILAFSNAGANLPNNGLTTANWINHPIVDYKAVLTFDDGHVLTQQYDWVCPYSSMNDIPTCDGVIPDNTPVIRAGSQKDFKWKRVITFNNGCPVITVVYDIDIVDIVNDQTIPFISATRNV